MPIMYLSYIAWVSYKYKDQREANSGRKTGLQKSVKSIFPKIDVYKMQLQFRGWRSGTHCELELWHSNDHQYHHLSHNYYMRGAVLSASNTSLNLIPIIALGSRYYQPICRL